MWVDIAVEGGRMAGYLAKARNAGPGLVMLQEIFGVNDAMQQKARTFAEEGFTVLVPDLFWRQQPRVSLGYTEQDRKAGFGYMQNFDFAAGVRDIAAAARWLEGETGGKVGVIGFCLGGKLAVAATAAYPFAAVASFYGVKLEADPERLAAVQVPLQIHVGDKDAHVPMSSVDAIRSIVKDKPTAEVFIYPGAQHGFFNAARAEVFSPQAAKQARQRAVALFENALG
jgi:carboxymethylenebutenolidase